MTQNTLVSHDKGFIRLSGDIDLMWASKLKRLEKHLLNQDFLVIDLSDVTYVDTTFLSFLRRLKNQPNKNMRSSIKLVGFNHKFRRIIEVTGFANLFEIEWKV